MLWKKMIRDMRESKGAYIASLVIIIIGLLLFTAMNLAVENLRSSREDFYTRQHFADGFASVRSIPSTETAKLSSIPGIDRIQGRLVREVQVLNLAREENVYLRLVSLDPGEENPINGMRLELGNPLQPREPNVWVDNKFFEANDLALEDGLQVIAGGRAQDLIIVGVGRSPEFIYATRSVTDVYPTPETFGIAFVPSDVMKRMFPEEPGYNDLVFTLESGTVYDDVKDVLEARLKRFGLLSLFPRDDQMSHLYLDMEITGVSAMSKGMPFLFLSISAMILYIVLKRLVEQQRGQIGIMKAVGYTDREILLHYMVYAIAMGLIGGLLGGLLGSAASYPFMAIFEEFFNMPDLQGRFSLVRLILAVGLSLFFATIAGYQGCKRVLTLEPAEAMRPPVPSITERVFLEKVQFFWNMLTVQGMMAVRNMSRNKARSFFVFVGITFCFAIVALTWSMNDMIQKLLFDQFEKVELYDVKITLAAPASAQPLTRELQRVPGVIAVDPMAEVPLKLRHQWREQDIQVIAVPGDSSYYRVLDKDDRRIFLPKQGILLSERLAMLLDARPGTMIQAENLLVESDDTPPEVEVIAIIPQYMGMNAYMELGALQRLLAAPDLATSLMVGIEPEAVEGLKETYRQTHRIAGIDEQEQRLNLLRSMMDLYGRVVYIYAYMGIIIGFSIIYSSSIITLSERSRELASMMVLGMTPREVLEVITFEQWFTGSLGMIAGIPLARTLLSLLSQATSTDMYTVPTVISTQSFFMAFVITSLSIWIAQRTSAKKIRSLSLVEVLKSSE
ncbi:MAG: FtsX-like permease family protein [Bacillota bacterium]|nr:FtsX-like permease family protein [Bacillota bacterium]